MPSLGNLWYQVMLKDMTDADLQKLEQKLKNLGVTVDTSHIRQQIEASVGATPFNATVTFGNARASLDAALAGSNKANVEVIASKLHDSINAALDKYTGKALIVPKTKDLRKAVNDALLSAGFEINIGKVKGLTTTINNALGSDHNIKVSVDPKKLADAIDKAVKSYKGGTQIPLEAKEKILHDSIRKALKSEKFPIKVIVDKAEAQDAVRQALQAAGLQNSGFTASDKRAWDAQSRRMEAQARVAAQNALAQRRLAEAHNAAQRAAESHINSSISLDSAMRGNIRIAGELGPMLASAYSVIALKNFMQKVVEIGGELEKQKLAMSAILGDKGMANTITSQINTLAVKSPFGMLELNQYAKQLTAFQIPYNELYDTMKRMADVSAAVGVDMGRIILAYGQVRAAKFLKGTELRQFTEANIPMIDMLAQRFTKLKGEMVSAGDVMDMISNKEVTFEDVKAVLWELTGEGGKFYNMQEVLSESVQAKWKNLSDAIDLMFADIAESTSGPLKGLAELLTALTSRWKAIAMIIASAAGTFGVAKAATLAWNAALSKTTLSAIKDAESAKQIEAANLRVASTYRKLTAAEQDLIHTKGRLTAVQYVQLAAEGKLTKEQVLRLIALKKLDANTIGHLRSVLGITKAEVSAAQATKAWRVRMAQLGATMRSVGSSIAGFFLNPLTIAMAAVGAVTALWQRNSDEMQRAEEIGKNVATSASEGARNLKASLETIKPGEGLSDTQLTQGIEQMQQLIKDYSPTPITDINDALVAQDGHVRTLIEQYTILRDRVEKLANDYKGMDNTWMGDNTSEAMKATDGGNWFTQLFDDNLAENAKDYTNALGRVTDRIAKYSREYADNMKNAVIAALNADEGFRKATSGMAFYDEKLKFLVDNSEKYYNAVTAFDADMNKRDNGEHLDYFSNTEQIKAAREELLKDTDKFIADYNSRMRQMGINPALMTEGQKTQLAIALQSMLEQMEDAGEDAKALMAQKMEEAWGLTGMIIEDKIGPSMQEKFRTLVGQSTDEGVKSAVRKLQYEGYTALSDAEKELVDKLMNQAKTQTMGELGILNDKMQAYLTAHPLSQLITLSYASDAPSDLAKEIVKSKGYQGLTDSTNRYVTSWTKGNRVYDARNAAQSALQAAKNELDAAKKVGVGVETAQKKWDEVWNAIQYLGWTDLATKDQKSNKPNKPNKPNKHTDSGSDKDPFAEAIKERINLLKKAKSEYESLAKILGTEGASKELANSPIFAGLKANKFLPEQAIPKTFDEYEKALDKLQKQLTAKGLKNKKHRELNIEIEEVKLNIKKKKIEEGLKLALDKVSKEAERQLADWNLFDKIRKATGNQNLAMSIAFGMNVKTETDYPTMIKQQLKKTVDTAEAALSKVKPKKGESPYEAQGYNYDTLKKLYDARDTEEGMQAWTAVPEEIRKAWEKANGDILKYFDQQREAVANILNEYQTLQDKIAAINAKRNLALETINAKDEQGNYILSDDERAKRSKTVNIKADYELFTQSNDYLRFFNNIYGLTMDEANRIGDLIQLNLNQRLQDAQISAYDYEKEMEKVRKQLEALRNVKSDAMTFLTGGLKGLNQKRLQKAEGGLANNEDYQKALADQIAAQNALNKAQEEGDEKAIEAAEAQLALANQSVKAFTKIRDAIIADQEKMQNVLDVANIASNIAGGMSDAFNSIRDMADAYGVDTESGAWEDIAAVMDTLTTVTEGVQKVVQSAMNGDIGGILSGVVSTITSPFTIWSKLHDKKLQKLIDRSKEAAQIMQNQYDILEKRMANFLGNAANMKVEGYDGEGGAYGKQRELMQGQLAELEKQRQAEIDKKKTDDSVVEDYNKQIEEMKISIRDFALEAAKDIYGIDLNGWAQQLGDSLVDAFATGEDAAKAFDKTVGDILRDVTSKMISQDILAPMFGDLRDFLFGENGMSGAFGADFKLDASEVAAMKEYLDKIKNQGIPAAEELFDAINEATGGLLDNTDKAKDGLSAGIQNITEDTADLLASYVNGVRGDVALEVHDYWPKLLEMVPQFNVIAQSQLDAQRQIAENTLRNAIAAETIVKSNNDISRLLVRVTQGGAKFYVN